MHVPVSLDMQQPSWDLTDCMQWLCCYSCTLAQEVRTADAYEVVLVVQDTLQDKQPMPMHHRHHPTPTAAAVRSLDDGVTVPPSSVSATRT